MADNKFTFSYRAPTPNERREAESIRNFYEEERSPDTLTRLKKLDAHVKNAAKIPSIATGIAGTLIFGLGLSMVLVWEMLVFGSIVALAGVASAACAYPLYRFILTREKNDHREEILRLSGEILQKNHN